MATTPQSALWSDIALAIKAQLVSVTEIDEAYVRLVASDDYKLDPIDAKYLVVRMYGPDPFTDAGAGRYARPLRRLVRVYIYTRDSSDQFGDDTEALTATEGHEALLLQVMDALDEFWPQSDEEENLTIEPLHPMDSEQGPPTRKAEDDLGVLRSHLDYQAVYLAQVNTPQP